MEEQQALTVTKTLVPDVQLNVNDVKKYIAPTATDKELFMFMNISKSYGLNPFKREIHFVKYGSNPGSIIVGYESYIKRAERTGLLDGWEIALGKDELGEKATITIHRKDRSKPFVWSVYRDEFDQQQANWKKMPKFMLRKVAIAQGFRLAFPEDIGGMPYIPEEIPQTQGRTSEELPQEHVTVLDRSLPDVMPLEEHPMGLEQGQDNSIKPMTIPQKKKLFAMLRDHGVERDQMSEFVSWAGIVTSKAASDAFDNMDALVAEFKQGSRE